MSDTASMGVRSQLVVAFALSLVLAGASVGLLWRAQVDWHTQAFWLSHTYEVLAASEAFLRSMQDAELAQQAYLLSVAEESKQAFERGARHAQSNLLLLSMLTMDNPAQRPRTDLLERLTARRLSQLRQPLDLARRGQRDLALAGLATPEVRALRRELRALVVEFQAEEHRLLRPRNAAWQRGQRVVAWLTSTLVVGVVGVLALLAVLLERGLARPLRAYAAVARAVADGDLTRPAPADCPPEFDGLRLAFQRMQAALSARAVLLERRAKADQVLRAVASDAAAAPGPAESLQASAAMCLAHTEAQRVSAYVPSDGGPLRCVAQASGPGACLGAGVSANLIREVFAQDEVRLTSARGEPSLACCPMRDGGQVVGVWVVETLKPLGQDDLALFQGIADEAGRALVRAQHLQSLEALTVELQLSQRLVMAERDRAVWDATRDGLTRLANRGYADRWLAEAMERARASQQPLSLLLLDLDHFKAVNDTYGHAAGDRALVAVASVLRDAVRDGDLVGRYGGEEFLVGLLNCDLNAAERRAEVIRHAVAELKVGQVEALSVSVGAAQWGGDESCVDWVARADGALYAAKRAGRNRVSVAGGRG